jgi:hypothetical protein
MHFKITDVDELNLDTEELYLDTDEWNLDTGRILH